MKKNVAFTLISFAVLKWHECLSFQLPFELTVEIPVQLHLELEVNLLVRNVIEREIEREKVQMKPPYSFKSVKGEGLISLLQEKACNGEMETNVMLTLLFYVAITGKIM